MDEIKDNLGQNVSVIESSVVVPEPDRCSLYYDRVPAKPECILEVHDFSESLKTIDLKNELNGAGFRNKYELRWVDDTHAIAIFHTVAASEAALEGGAALKTIKLRKLEDGTDLSKEKAELCMSKAGSTIQGPRPETSTLIARRMLGGALGVSMSLPTDLEEKEKDKLKTARKAKDELSVSATGTEPEMH